MPVLECTEWEYQSVKSIYTLFTQSIPPPTIHAKQDLSDFPGALGGWPVLWQRLHRKGLLLPEVVDLLWRIFHNIVNTRVRQFRLNKVDHPNCPLCLSKGSVFLDTILHRVTDCYKVRGLWCWLRQSMIRLCQFHQPQTKINEISNFEIFYLLFPPTLATTLINTLVWLQCNYVSVLMTDGWSGHLSSFQRVKAKLSHRYLSHLATKGEPLFSLGHLF